MTPTAADGDLPPTALVRVNNTHRLIPSKYRPGGESVLARIAGSDADLADLFDLDHATNERLLAENSLLPGIGPQELVFDVPNCRVVNAVFTHPHPLGSRFNGPERGAWYAAFALETAQAEVAFHKATEYAEIGRFDDSVTYDDYLADFSAEFHDIRDDDRFAACHDPDSYRVSQAWPTGCWTRVHWASPIGAPGMPADPASPASGPRSSAMFAAIRLGVSSGTDPHNPRSKRREEADYDAGCASRTHSIFLFDN